MNVINWIVANGVQLLAILGGVHVIIGTIGNLTGSKSVQGLDDVITNILNILAGFFKSQTTPKA
jgi:uncharacterized membrane protein